METKAPPGRTPILPARIEWHLLRFELAVKGRTHHNLKRIHCAAPKQMRLSQT